MPGLDSGIKLDQACINKFAEMKKISTCPYDYLLLEIRQDDPEAKKVGSKSPPESVYVKEEVAKGKSEEELGSAEVDGVEASFHQLTKTMKEQYSTEPVYVVMYVKVNIAGQTANEKLVLIGWIPDDSPMKKKMKYSSTIDSVAKKIPDLSAKITCNDWDDLRYSNVKKIASSGKSS